MSPIRSIIVLGLLLLCVACKDRQAAPDPPPPQPEAEEEAADEETAHDAPGIRQAYGIPLPPEVTLVREGQRSIYVETKLSVDEVRQFFEERLVDFELLQEDRRRFRLVGLRSGMPYVYVWYRRANLPTAIRFIEGFLPPDAEGTDSEGSAAKQPKQDRTKGAAVTERLPDGRPLAPGARWGEPYTPPPGSPLDQPRFRPNFGKPYGTWSMN